MALTIAARPGGAGGARRGNLLLEIMLERSSQNNSPRLLRLSTGPASSLRHPSRVGKSALGLESFLAVRSLQSVAAEHLRRSANGHRDVPPAKARTIAFVGRAESLRIGQRVQREAALAHNLRWRQQGWMIRLQK
jgi:hypothetical protein